jgi:hypothetical protein
MISETILDYRISGRLGGGSYKVEDTRVDRFVALKSLRDGPALKANAKKQIFSPGFPLGN